MGLNRLIFRQFDFTGSQFSEKLCLNAGTREALNARRGTLSPFFDLMKKCILSCLLFIVNNCNAFLLILFLACWATIIGGMGICLWAYSEVASRPLICPNLMDPCFMPSPNGTWCNKAQCQESQCVWFTSIENQLSCVGMISDPSNPISYVAITFLLVICFFAMTYTCSLRADCSKTENLPN